jgi:hypothetical protein
MDALLPETSHKNSLSELSQFQLNLASETVLTKEKDCRTSSSPSSLYFAQTLD